MKYNFQAAAPGIQAGSKMFQNALGLMYQKEREEEEKWKRLRDKLAIDIYKDDPTLAGDVAKYDVKDAQSFQKLAKELGPAIKEIRDQASKNKETKDFDAFKKRTDYTVAQRPGLGDYTMKRFIDATFRPKGASTQQKLDYYEKKKQIDKRYEDPDNPDKAPDLSLTHKIGTAVETVEDIFRSGISDRKIVVPKNTIEKDAGPMIKAFEAGDINTYNTYRAKLRNLIKEKASKAVENYWWTANEKQAVDKVLGDFDRAYPQIQSKAPAPTQGSTVATPAKKSTGPATPKTSEQDKQVEKTYDGKKLIVDGKQMIVDGKQMIVKNSRINDILQRALLGEQISEEEIDLIKPYLK
jgi:hypothetical protein